MYSSVTPRALRHFLRVHGEGDRAVAWVAKQQLGLITTRQLEAVGIGRGAISARRARELLHPVHRGVYLVGHATLVPGARALAAVLACAPWAFVSHNAAAALWDWMETEPAVVDITVMGRNCRSRAGIVVHKAHTLHPRDRTTRCGIPITAPARTLIDHAATASYEESERGIAEAFALKLVSDRQLIAAIERAPYRVGVAQVRAILGCGVRKRSPARHRSQRRRL